MPAVLNGDTRPLRTVADPRSPTSPKRTKAADGYPSPTALEIEEGTAHKLWWDCLDLLKRSPHSRMLRAEKEAAEQAWEGLCMALYAIQPHPATTRCRACHVRLYGRISCLGCGDAGRLETG